MQENSREKYLYHNTEKLLSRYRDVAWSIEVSAMQTQINLELGLGCKLEEFLDMTYQAGFDVSDVNIEEQLRTIERNKKMLEIIDKAVELLRKKSGNGESYYWIIYYTYLSEKSSTCVDDVISRIEDKTEPMSWKTYFIRRKKAIELLSTILWGFATKDCIHTFEMFIE